MKLLEVQLRDMSAMGGLPGATSMLTLENEPELIDGWVRFKDKAGNWHRVPSDLVRRVTECRQSLESEGELSKVPVAQNAQLAPDGQQRRPVGRPPRVPGA